MRDLIRPDAERGRGRCRTERQIQNRIFRLTRHSGGLRKINGAPRPAGDGSSREFLDRGMNIRSVAVSRTSRRRQRGHHVAQSNCGASLSRRPNARQLATSQDALRRLWGRLPRRPNAGQLTITANKKPRPRPGSVVSCSGVLPERGLHLVFLQGVGKLSEKLRASPLFQYLAEPPRLPSCERRKKAMSTRHHATILRRSDGFCRGPGGAACGRLISPLAHQPEVAPRICSTLEPLSRSLFFILPRGRGRQSRTSSIVCR
jgi:hypothetical protein